MVRLEELEDEHFVYKPETTADGALLADDDEDYTDTDSSISDDDIESRTQPDESLFDRISALRDIVPPKTRARITSATSTIFSAANTTVSYGGKGLWVVATSILLLGIPYALALGEEQQYAEEERQRGMMEQGAQGMMQPGQEEAKPAL